MRRHLGMPTSLAACAVLLLASCSCGTSPVVIVELRTDLVVGAEIARARTSVVLAGDGGLPLQTSRELVPSMDLVSGARIAELGPLTPGPHEVVLELLDGNGVLVVRRRALIEVVQATVATIVITRSCVGRTCPSAGDEPSATECLAMRCVVPECTPEHPERCPEPSCADDSDCPMPGGCLAGRCIEGACFEVPDDDACAGGSCEPDGSCTGAVPDAGPRPCTTPADCDDDNPCTGEACLPTGCDNPPNAAGCDDGVFCNGLDQCAGGSCSMHAGDPCAGSTTCDEAMDTCLGCTSDADCGGTAYGDWGGCGSFADACDTSGTRSRTVRTFTCTGGACVPHDGMQTEPCSRTTDGDPCGGTTCDGWGGCDYADDCDESASRSRSCTDYACSGGTCNGSARTETEGCSRSTTGASCGATSCTDWSTCSGFGSICGETGSQDRTCTDYTCGGGSCGASMRMETQACTRDTDGRSCLGGDPCELFMCVDGSCDPQGPCTCYVDCRPACSMCPLIP